MFGDKRVIAVWAVHPDDQVVFDTIAEVRRRWPADRVIVICALWRAETFRPTVDEAIATKSFRGGRMWRLARKLILRRIHLNVLACGDEDIHYHTAEGTLNLVNAVKRRTLVGVHVRDSLVIFPPEVQAKRTLFVAWSALIGAASAVSPSTGLSLLGLIALSVAADKAYRLYMDKFNHLYYWAHLSFRREEFPYVSHGWMRPYGETYYNRAMRSLEGPGRNGYDINCDGFPVYRPSRADATLPTRFHFINTHNRELDKPEETVFVLGGSVAQGLIGDPDSYHCRLEAKLRASGHALRVIPWAIGGYQSTQSRVAAELSLIERKPFAVVNLDFYNDAHFMMMGVPPGDTQRSQRKYLAENSPAFRMLSPLFDHSAIARQCWQSIYSGIATRHMTTLLEDSERLGQGIRDAVSIYLGNMKRINAMCRAEGIKHLAFVQPFRDDIRARDQLQSVLDNPKAAIMNRCYAELRDRLAHDSSLSEVIVGEPIFDRADYSDEVHFFPSGQEKVAAHMAARMLSDFLKESATPAPANLRE